MAKPTLSSIGSLVNERRGGRGIREVAREVGVSAATLSRVENGKVPDLGTFSKICAWLQIDAGEILGYKSSVGTMPAENQNIISVHLRAERFQTPEIAEALTDMILKAQQMVSEKYT